MTIALTGTNGLFTRLGAIGAALMYCNRLLKKEDLSADFGSLHALGLQIDTIRAQYSVTGNPNLNLTDQLYAIRDSQRAAQSGYLTSLQNLAIQTLNQMVNDDVPQSVLSVQNSLNVLISQMNSSSASVSRPVISSSTAALSSNNGNGVILVSTLNPANGLAYELAFNESITFTCSSDSQTTATAGSETFLAVSPAQASSQILWNWPAGSGVNLQMTAIDGSLTTNNYLQNGGFTVFSPANTPTNWTIVTGSAGSTIIDPGTSQGFLTGQTCLEMASDGSTTIALKQAVALEPLTAYGMCVWLKGSATIAAGSLTISLIDGNNVVINDAAGAANTKTVASTAITTGFQPFAATFRTPRVLPASGVFLRIAQSTAFTNTKNLFVANLALSDPTQLYTSGPLVCIFSGNAGFIVNDKFTVNISNNRTITTPPDATGAYTPGIAILQTLCEQFFSMRSLGVQIPSSGVPTVGDNLVL